MKRVFLTEKQKKFCESFIKTNDMKEALKSAGYYLKNKTLKSLLENKLILEYIEDLKERERKREIAAGDEVLKILTRIARGEVTGEDETKRPTVSERLKAIELLIKKQGGGKEEGEGLTVIVEDDYGGEIQG